MIQVGTTEAFAIYDAACLAEDLDTATDIESERRWDAGRNAFRATVETSADALMLIARLRSSSDLSFKAGRSLAVIIKRGVTSADLPALR